MNREEIIRMAREAGLMAFKYPDLISKGDWENLERFAALVAAAKDAEHVEKLKNDIHSCGPTCTRYACVAVREAVEAEREACAKVCDDLAELNRTSPTDSMWEQEECAAAIRSRKDNT